MILLIKFDIFQMKPQLFKERRNMMEPQMMMSGKHKQIFVLAFLIHQYADLRR